MPVRVQYGWHNLHSGGKGDVLWSPQQNGAEVRLGDILPTVVMGLVIDGEEKIGTACGENPVDTIFRCFCQMVGCGAVLVSCNARYRHRKGSPTTRVNVRIGVDGRKEEGFGQDPDFGKALLLALIGAVNKIQEGGN